MKNISAVSVPKYKTGNYKEIEKDIYLGPDGYVMTLSFEQEPDLGEGTFSNNISQYPLEDLLEKYFVFVSDFYDTINNGESNQCIVELASNNLEDIQTVKEVIGKHIYNVIIMEDNEEYIELIME